MVTVENYDYGRKSRLTITDGKLQKLDIQDGVIINLEIELDNLLLPVINQAEYSKIKEKADKYDALMKLIQEGACKFV